MRTFVRRGAVVAASVALVTVLAPASADAASKKRGDLKICFENSTLLSALALDAVADGPSHREKDLLGGDCKKWDVRKGQYKVTLDDVQEFSDTAFANETVYNEEHDESRVDFAACGVDGAGNELAPEFSAEVTRNGDDYDVFTFGPRSNDFADVITGDFPRSPLLSEFPITTNVQKDRRTKVDFRLRCVPFAQPPIFLD